MVITIRLSPAGARVIKMLAPYPWEPGHNDVTIEGTSVTFGLAYAPHLAAQSDAPGFSRKDRTIILDAIRTLT